MGKDRFRRGDMLSLVEKVEGTEGGIGDGDWGLEWTRRDELMIYELTKIGRLI